MGEPRTIIIGAGFGGVAAAIELQSHGLGDVTIVDRAPGLGGTWFYNSYPGSACDVPSHLYSFSFAKRKDWSRLCSPQREILNYLGDVAREHGLLPKMHFNADVTACNWDDVAHTWTVTAADGRSWEGDALVLATGQLHQPALPRLPGQDRFKGHTFHSSGWDHDYDLRGKRVAVVGTGASAVQFVPEIAPEVERLVVFQRTGNWFLPRKNRPYPGLAKKAFEHVPGLQEFRRRFIYHYGESLTLMIRNPRTWGKVGHWKSWAFMRMQLRDPEVRRKAWPDYTFGCKRVLFSSHFLPALQRPNVQLVTDAIERASERGVVTADGTEHEVDCIIWGTGFRTNDFMFPMEITGRDGVSLRDTWAGGPHAHLGLTVPGYPNMFVMYGPNTNTSGGSIIVYLEAQARYLRQALQHVQARGASAIEVRREVEEAFDHDVQKRFDGTAWTQCDSWYRNPNGRVIANWPLYMKDYEARTATLDPSEFTFLEAPDRETVGPAS